MECIDELNAWIFVALAESGNARHKLNSDQQTKAANFFQNCRIAADQRLQTFLHVSTERPCIFFKPVATDNLKNFEPDRTSQRCAPERAAVRPGREQIAVRCASPERAHGKTASDGLRPRNAVRLEILCTGRAFEQTLITGETTCSKIAALHLIDEQQEIFFVAEFAQTEEILRTNGLNSTLALDTLDQYRGGRGRNRASNGLEIVETNMSETRNRGAEAFLYFLLTGRSDAGKCPPMKRVQSCDNFKSTLVVAEFSRQFVESFVRFRAAVRKEDFAWSGEVDEFLRQAALRFGVIQIRNVDQLL